MIFISYWFKIRLNSNTFRRSSFFFSGGSFHVKSATWWTQILRKFGIQLRPQRSEDVHLWVPGIFFILQVVFKISAKYMTCRVWLNMEWPWQLNFARAFSQNIKIDFWCASANASDISNDSCNLRGAGVTNAIFKGEVGTEQLGVAGWSTSGICWSTGSCWPPWVLGPASSTTAF